MRVENFLLVAGQDYSKYNLQAFSERAPVRAFDYRTCPSGYQVRILHSVQAKRNKIPLAGCLYFSW